MIPWSFAADFPSILETVRAQGYLFVPNVLDGVTCQHLSAEVDRLKLEFGDHVTHPINPGTPQEVRQWHERAYYPLGDPEVPMGTGLCRGLATEITGHLEAFPELAGWIPNEIGYQRYRAPHDWISPHRDRRSDRLLSVTFTLAGSAWMRIYASDVNPPDYRRLTQIGEYLTAPGMALFLRAPGFGSGEQVIHEVMSPLSSSRLIVNLRMRPTVLVPPTEGEAVRRGV